MSRYSRLGKRDRLVQSLAGERAMAAYLPPDHPKYAASQARLRELEAAIPPKRERVVRPVDGKPAMPLEREIQRACLMLLRVHPKVAFAYRVNSGVFTEQNSDGSTRYINAHTMPGMSDLCAVLKGSGRACYFEVKRPGQKPTRLQEQFLERARQAGAIAAVVYDAQEIVELLT